MIRILFDEAGDAHHDIFFKVDASPSFIQVADLYFVGDFLSPLVSDEVTKEALMIEFIKYIKKQIENSGDKERFIPIDLSDQYVGGMLVGRKTRDLIIVKYGYTQKILGFQISVDGIDKVMLDKDPEFKVEREWTISISEIIKGLDWSIERIKTVTV